MLEFEAKHGGSPLTFRAEPIKPEKVAKLVLKAIIKKKLSCTFPDLTHFSLNLLCVFLR